MRGKLSKLGVATLCSLSITFLLASISLTDQSRSLQIFFTSDVFGYLKPCG